MADMEAVIRRLDRICDYLSAEQLKGRTEIVRCKDCKHGVNTVINGVCLYVTCGGVDHRPEWFCADGERED